MSEQILDLPIRQMLNELASKAPTPGGGSIAALTGAMAAGLLTMVCDLTIGKKAYVEFEPQAISLREQAEAQRAELESLAQADIDVFNNLMAAYKLPKTTDADAATRRAAIQNVTRQATEVPLRVARASAALLPLCRPLAEGGSRNAISDVGVAALLIQSAIPSAILNVDINLATLEDKLFVNETRAQLEDLTAGVNDEIADVLKIVRARIAE